MLRILYYERAEICLEIAIEEETITRISFCDKALNHVVRFCGSLMNTSPETCRILICLSLPPEARFN